MIPYFPAPVAEVGGMRFHAFGPMVGLALLTGSAIYLRRTRRQGLDVGFTRLFIFSIAAGGYLIAHLLHVLIFAPAFTLSRALDFTTSIYSFGGVVGGLLIGGLLFWVFRIPAKQRHMHLDNLAFAFVLAWIFGRAGCSLVHDHIGIASTSFLAVRFPNGPHYDLGILELLFTLLVAGFFLWMDGNPQRRGFYLALFLICYGMFRLYRDRLEVEPHRWNGISLDGVFAAACLMGGIWYAFTARSTDER
jgi:phosphatidylglycerol:prolipoprotein diacylglycerol transferase